MCRVTYKLWGSGVVGYFSVAARASMLIENFRSIKDARSIDKPDQVAIVEVTEPMHLVHRGDGVAQANHNLGRELEAHVHALRPDVEQQVSRCGDRVTRSCVKLPKWM